MGPWWRDPDRPTRRLSTRTGPLAAVALLAVAPWVAAGVDSTLALYQAARDAGRVGSLQARAMADPAKASQPPTPVAGMNVSLLPWTEAVEARLDAIKAQSRNSIQTYLSSVSDVRAVLTAWERDVSAGGGKDLVRQATTDAEGAVRFTDVPAGDWLLVAWRGEATKTERTVKPRRDDSKFVAGPSTTGHTVISIWRSKVAVAPGETAEASLTDRGVWLSGIAAETKAPPPSPIGAGHHKNR